MVKRAVDISVEGFIELMKAIKPGFKEYQAQAIVEYFIKNNGGCCSRPQFLTTDKITI